MSDVRDPLSELVEGFDDPISIDELQARRTTLAPSPSRRFGTRPAFLSAAACALLLLFGGLVWSGIDESPTEVTVGTEEGPTGNADTGPADTLADPGVPTYTGTFGGICPFLSQESIERAFAHVPEGTPPRFDLLSTAELCLTATRSFGEVDGFDLTVVRQAEDQATIAFAGPSGEAGEVELIRGLSANAPWVASAITSERLAVARVVTDVDADGQRTRLRVTIASSFAGQAELHVDRVSGVLLEPTADSLVDLSEGTNDIVVALDPVVRNEDLVIRLEATDTTGAPVLTQFRWAT